MKTCDLNTGLGQLSHAYTRLRERLAEARTDWDDQARRDFEQTHLHEVPARMQLLVAAVHRLAEVLEKAERECGDHAEQT